MDKRGVGYDADYPKGQIKEILHILASTHRLAGLRNLGIAIASSNIFVDPLGFRLCLTDPVKVGQKVGVLLFKDVSEIVETVRDRNIIVGYSAVPPAASMQRH